MPSSPHTPGTVSGLPWSADRSQTQNDSFFFVTLHRTCLSRPGCCPISTAAHQARMLPPPAQAKRFQAVKSPYHIPIRELAKTRQSQDDISPRCHSVLIPSYHTRPQIASIIYKFTCYVIVHWISVRNGQRYSDNLQGRLPAIKDKNFSSIMAAAPVPYCSLYGTGYHICIKITSS